jgi:hypothetical protein
MLKIAHHETVNEDRWILSGHLAGLWVAELRSCWNQVRGRSRGRKCVIELNDVTLIDENGEGLLQDLKCEGAELVARGVYTRHLIENLKSKK